ncbi:S8 family peptidase [Vibrio cholerae]|uniref:S8 family peptidase n=1 Tax=Vibrio cholerae TaxID=666 RepID=UPI0031DE6ACD|nr:S8 family peptidase [Vibrio cholerae]
MKNNPLQIVLNPNEYIHKPDPNVGGSQEDFFGGRDEDFVEHKNSLLRQVRNVKESLRSSRRDVAVVKVDLNPSALAKSHRPMKSLLPNTKSPHIGGLKIGSLLFQVSDSSLNWLEQKIYSTEEESNLVYDKYKKKMVYKPSIARSETGAIEKITLYSKDEKVSFSAVEATQWISDKAVCSGYFVELMEFEDTKSSSSTDTLSNKLKHELREQLLRLGAGVVLSPANADSLSSNVFYLRLYSGGHRDSSIDFQNAIFDSYKHRNYVDYDVVRHELLLSILAESAIVKKVWLPPKISRSETLSKEFFQELILPKKVGLDYPKVGLIDSGTANSSIAQWKIGESKGFGEMDCDPDHGSQVASLLVGAKALNPHIDHLEDDGCLIYDIWTPIHSEKNSFFEYFDGYGEFFDWLDIEVKEAKRNGIRIFNFSINLRELVRDDNYSYAAAQIDRISQKHDVIFVISAGNLEPIDFRAKWPSQLAIASDIDRLQQPAEAISAITVGALNPPGSKEHIHCTPTVYSRRGPGVAMGVKPDVVHYGGFYQNLSIPGLMSLNSDGQIVSEGGTSFSAPLVAKTLATIENRLNKAVSRNALIALLIHHSNNPDVTNNKSIESSIRRRFVGFGLPCKAQDMLVTDDYAITIMFEGNIKKGEVAEFKFQWPESLTTDDGKCKGGATLTLVYDPIIKAKFGAEYCRVNVDAALQQEKLENNKWVYRKNCDSIWKTKVGNDSYYEKSQIEHGLKWWPVKKYRKEMPQGVGKSSNWRLQVTSTERESGDFPAGGINFCAIITIEDINKESSKVFDELNQTLRATGVDIRSINVSTNIEVKS